jgi:hypothetical protein
MTLVGSKISVLYLGDDEIFTADIKSKFRDYLVVRNLEFNQIKSENLNWKVDALTTIFAGLPHIVYIDFVSYQEHYDEMLALIALLKRNSLTKKVPVFGLLSDSKEMEKTGIVLSAGVNYCFVKGDSYRTLVFDSAYVAVDDNLRFPRYATARRIDLPYQISVVSSLVSISEDKILLDSDLTIDFEEGRKLRLNLNLFEDFNAKEFPVSHTYDFPQKYNMMNSYEVKIPYPGPWDEIDEFTIQKDTMLTWLENYHDNLDSFDGNVLIVSNKIEDHQVLDVKGLEKLNLHISEYFDEGFTVVDAVKPDILFVSLELDGDTLPGYMPNDYETLEKLFFHIGGMEEFGPIVVIFNSKSTSDAGQKVFDYRKLVASQSKFNIEAVESMLNLFREGATKEESLYKYFRVGDSRRYAEVDIQVRVTALTEHEMTFITHADLPLYTNIRVRDPVDMFLIIVPPTWELEKSVEGKHYMGFIHSVLEEELEILRMFVNQIIYRPIEKFEFDRKVVNLEEEEAKREMHKPREEVKPKIDRYEVVRKNVTGFKSKL